MDRLEPRLKPPATKGHVSVARLVDYWYVACPSSTLAARPLGRTVVGIPIVLFRGTDGRPGALLDRCPHRNVPLSLGRVVGGRHLQCGYHGWEFDPEGRCQKIPGLPAGVDRERRVDAFPVIEQDGLIWVYPVASAQPATSPPDLPRLGREYVRVVREVRADASLHAVMENALDVPHTAFLHKGLFRSEKADAEKNEITAVVRRRAAPRDAEYQGAPRPTGAVAKLLSPSGGTVEHWDRFILPSIAQVEYRLGTENHFLVTSLATPETDFSTRMCAVVEFKLRVPARAIKPILEPLALRIFGQDAAILKAQTETVQRFGGEQFTSTEADVLGADIWRLLRQAERGELGAGPEAVVERRVRLLV